jgi:exodeoxyribonuclease VII large subunit
MSDLFFEEKTNATTTIESDFLDINAKVKDLGGQIDWVFTHRKKEYVAEILALSKHKSVAIKRKIALGIGLIGSTQIIDELQTWQLSEADRQTWLNIETTIDKLTRKNDNPDLEDNVRILSVSEALKQIKQTVSHNEFQIEGELAEVKAIGTMYYFALKDKEDTRIDCYLYSGKAYSFGFPINEGWEVRARGKFKIDKYGKLKFEIENLQLTGQGQLLRNLQILEQKLEDEGLFDPARKRLINPVPSNILLIASPNSAAIDDFQKVLRSRRSNITIYYLPIKTQGVGAESDILQKLHIANSFCKELSIQTIVITRGGGSKDDLMVFNSEKIVRAIHSLQAPTIVAIGHERDTCLSEKVSDLRASTPSNAAELLSISNFEIKQYLASIENLVNNYFQTRKSEYKIFGNSLYGYISKLIETQIYQSKSICTNIDQQLAQTIYGIKNIINSIVQTSYYSIKHELNSISHSLSSLSNLRITLTQSILTYRNQKDQLWNNIVFLQKNLITDNQSFVANLSKLLELYDTQKVLSLGYAIINQNGKVIETKSNFKSKQKTIIKFADGVVEV